MKNMVAEHWNNNSDKWFENIEHYIEAILVDPTIAFPAKVYEMINKSFPSLTGKKVCIPSSGDNVAAYAFCLLGAHVTSTDISVKQVQNAKAVANRYNWNIEFLCDDSMSLEKLKSNQFDLIYTSNGVHVWISNLKSMYETFNRILNEEGSYIFFDTHPIIRPFNGDGDVIEIVKEYKKTGPLPDEGGIEYAWRIEDYINNLVSSGFMINSMSEFNSTEKDLDNYDYLYASEEERRKDGGRRYNWIENKWAALPQCLGMSLKKYK